LINGRLLGPLEPEEVFAADDFSLLDKYCMSQFGEKLVNSLYTLFKNNDQENLSDLAMKLSSLLLSR